MDWNTAANIATGIGTVGALALAIWASRRKSVVQVKPQPFAVEVVKEIEDIFASRRDLDTHIKNFEAHVKNNTDRHGQIFHRMELLAQEMRSADAATLKELNEKFISIQRLLGRLENKIDSQSNL